MGTGLTPRRILEATLTWSALLYGLYSTAVVPVQQDDDVLIAVGLQMMAIALLGFLGSGDRRGLGAALVIVGVAAPVVSYATAPLYWHDADAFSTGFWATVALGAILGAPLVAIGIHVLRAPPAPKVKDPWWFAVVRWTVQAGLIVIVFAFQADDWDAGIPVVYAGLGIALVGLVLLIRRRMGVTRRGIGVLLMALGGTAAAVVGVSMLFVGGHISPAEAAVGVIPAALLLVLGWLLVSVGGRGPAPRSSVSAELREGPLSADGATEAAWDLMSGPDSPSSNSGRI